MNWLFDTDTCIYLMTECEPQRRERILDHLDSLSPDEIVSLSAITVFELSFGTRKGRWRKTNLTLLDQFLLDFAIVPFDEEVAHAGGAVRAALEKKGAPIGPLDTLIAGHALRLGATLVTDNTREFSRVPGLKLQNWSGA